MERTQTDPGSQRSRAATPFRLLVVALEPARGAELRKAIRAVVGSRRGEVMVLSPALTETQLKHALGDVDEAIEAAGRRLETTVEELRRAGVEASGDVGESDPIVAVEDALTRFSADEILVLTGPEAEEKPAEGDFFERAKERFEQSITRVRLDGGAGEAEVVDVSPGGGGSDADSREVAVAGSANLPAFSLGDIGGIVVAIVGTVLLAVLAANCPGGPEDFGCAARIGIALAAGLINAAHIVGLVLFESVRYRGFFDRFFARLSLFGTPAAIVVSLLLG